MRVTQSMLTTNMLRNLNLSYDRMSKLQDQMNTGKKITRPSQDPVIATKGMGYRIDLAKVEQFQRNIGEANTWLDTTDEVLGQAGDQLNRIKELVVQASNDTNNSEDREKIKVEIDEIRKQMKDIANTQIGDKYIFSGTHTSKPLYVDGVLNLELDATIDPKNGTGLTKDVSIETYDNINLKVNTNGYEIFEAMDSILAKVSEALTPGNATNNGGDIGNLLGDLANGTDTSLSSLQNRILEVRADVGARQNRIELMQNRLDYQSINITKQMSLNEDADYAEVISEMSIAESIHQASLSVGAKIIQQTLVDFMR